MMNVAHVHVNRHIETDKLINTNTYLLSQSTHTYTNKETNTYKAIQAFPAAHMRSRQNI